MPSGLQPRLTYQLPHEKTLCFAKAIGRSATNTLLGRNLMLAEEGLLSAFERAYDLIAADVHASLQRAPHHLHFDTAAWSERMKEIIRKPLRAALAAGAMAEWDLFNPRKSSEIEWLKRGGKKPSTTPPDVMQAVDDYLDETMHKPLWKDMAETVQKDLEKALKGGLKAGKHGKDLEDAVLKKVGPDENKSRAKRAARTMATGSVNAGAQKARDKLAKQGKIKGKEWRAMFINTREDHADADGQIVKHDEPFVVGGEECMYPGDPVLSIEQVANCQCLAASVPADEIPGG